ncbi:hypothetical protein J7E25_17185 [Agromyces sp. ISL-38]|uniref:hypothetical protein n=1 Tax=Agromyces sp. ISL-38 TaxID=2819107 RepID=UPI001BEBB739|nr:hypothetical protein [Agromyces sp. ISL-38]MBT2500832.1 hypothetical protein [Agromyces sp. ISL-38]MBT2519139.1 hypothetical protein [Streptomyces sp. ISL-90]
MILSWLFVIALAAGIFAVIDGITRARGRGSSVIAIIEIIAAVLFLLSLFFPGIPFGSLVLAIITTVLLVIQLVLRGGRRRGGVAVTVVALVLFILWIVLAQHWIVIPGVN